MNTNIKNILTTIVDMDQLKGFKIHRWNRTNLICFEIPRNLIKTVKDIENINNSGIYFLINEENNSLYIGQTSDILNQLTDHNRSEKEFTKAIAFIIDNNDLSKTFIDFLEWHYISELKNGKSWKMMNEEKRERKPNIDQFEEIQILNLISEIDSLLFCTGIILTERKNINETNEIFTCNKAKAIFENGKLTILSNSILPSIDAKKEKINNNSFYYKMLESMENQFIDWETESIIKKDNGEYKVLIKIKSLSPSKASNFARGRSSNGWEEWKNKKGETLNQVYRK